MMTNFFLFLISISIMSIVDGYASVRIVHSLNRYHKLVSVNDAVTLTDNSISPYLIDMKNIKLSELKGKALISKTLPTLSEVKTVIGPENFIKSTPVSLSFALMDILTVSLCILGSMKFLLPLFISLWTSPLLLNKGMHYFL